MGQWPYFHSAFAPCPEQYGQEGRRLPRCVFANTCQQRLKAPEEVVQKELGAPYTCQLLPETGQIVLTPERETTSPAPPSEPTQWDKTVCAVWRLRPLHLSWTEAWYPTPHVPTGVTYGHWPCVCNTLHQLAEQAARAFAAEDGTTIYGAACPLPVPHLYKCRPIPPTDVQQPGPPKYHWLPIAIDGTHEAGCAQCTIRDTTSSYGLASWWLMGGSKQWSTIYAVAQEVDPYQELVDASKVTIVDTARAIREPPLFRCADGKAQILLRGCKN